MAKTVFTNGSYLTPTFCNSIYDTSGGHLHDGIDSDGHSSKIMLTDASCVQGILPKANYESNATNGTFTAAITTGFLTVDQTGTFWWSKNGKCVTVMYPTLLGTSFNSSLEITPTTTWPAEIMPAHHLSLIAPVMDNMVIKSAKLMITDSTDVNWIFHCCSSDVYVVNQFTSSSTKGTVETSLSWITA